MARYSIVSYDNARSGQEGGRANRGEFDSALIHFDEALRLVEDAYAAAGAVRPAVKVG